MPGSPMAVGPAPIRIRASVLNVRNANLRSRRVGKVVRPFFLLVEVFSPSGDPFERLALRSSYCGFYARGQPRGHYPMGPEDSEIWADI
jgi:hypothetical protein